MKTLFKIIVTITLTALLFSCKKQDGVNPKPRHEGISIEKIEVIMHEGHLHGASFHANGQPTESPFLRRQEMTLIKTNNGWKKEKTNSVNDVKEDKPFVLVAGRHNSIEFLFYDENGNRLNKSFTENAKSKQIFFTSDFYTENKTNNKIELSNADDTVLIKYTYRDTDPDSIMYHKGKVEEGLVKLLSEKDETKEFGNIGMKGYFEVKKGRISYDLNINIVEWLNSEKPKNLEFNNLPKKTDEVNITTFTLPINVVSVHPWTDEETNIYLQEMGDYFGISADDFENIDLWGDYDPEGAKYWM